MEDLVSCLDEVRFRRVVAVWVEIAPCNVKRVACPLKLICNGWPVQLENFISDHLKPNRRIAPSAIRNLSFFEYPPNIMRKALKGGSTQYPTTLIAIYKHFDELLKRPKDWSGPDPIRWTV